MQISGTREGDSMEKSEERNKIISELQTVIKEQVEVKIIEIGARMGGDCIGSE